MNKELQSDLSAILALCRAAREADEKIPQKNWVSDDSDVLDGEGYLMADCFSLVSEQEDLYRASGIALFRNVTPFFARTVETAIENASFELSAPPYRGPTLATKERARALLQCIVTDCKEAGLIP